MISVSFLPPMSSSNTHMVTRGSKCASRAALLPTILAMAEPLLGGETQRSGVGGREETASWVGPQKACWIFYILTHMSPPPSPVKNVPPTTGNGKKIWSTLVFAVREVGQLSEPTPDLSSFSGREEGQSTLLTFLWRTGAAAQAGTASEGWAQCVLCAVSTGDSPRSPAGSGGGGAAFPTLCLFPAHPDSLWEVPLPLGEPCPSQNCLPVPGADNADFLASHGAASSFSAPAGVGSEYLTPPHVGAAKLRL